jgi:hypothetical protein
VDILPINVKKKNRKKNWFGDVKIVIENLLQDLDVWSMKNLVKSHLQKKVGFVIDAVEKVIIRQIVMRQNILKVMN